MKGKSVHDVRRLAHNDIIYWSGNLGDAMCVRKGNDRSVLAGFPWSCHTLSTSNSKILIGV